MKKLLLLLLAPAFLPAAAAFEPVFAGSHFEQPVAMAADPSTPGALYVVERKGVIHEMTLSGDATLLDIQAKVRTENTEEGLLGLAFHPGRQAAGRYYAIYSVKGARPRTTRLSEFIRGSGNERVLLEVEKRWGNHNGSTLAFGPDGYLYVSLGDGGSGGDPDGNAQNKRVLLGKILRIDVDTQEKGLPYACPNDNPFFHLNARGSEIWALGLRNPWRMAFDATTGRLWAGDVGQDAREEIDIIVKGGNYGWNYREGSRPYKGEAPEGLKLSEPVYDYGRKDGFCVIGGVVGRGKAPEWAQVAISSPISEARPCGAWTRPSPAKAACASKANAPSRQPRLGRTTRGGSMCLAIWAASSS